jgi:hypothetical protein
MPKMVLINTRDDMKWLREVHLPRLSAKYKSAVIHGNEDYPAQIDVYKTRNPSVLDELVIFVPNEDGSAFVRAFFSAF